MEQVTQPVISLQECDLSLKMSDLDMISLITSLFSSDIVSHRETSMSSHLTIICQLLT